jgi:TonB family protein
MKPLLFALTFLATVSLASAQTALSPAVPATSKKAKADAIFAPPPKYPVDAQGRHPEGRGVVIMDIDLQTGFVTSVHMEKSTGNKLLDAAAIEAFSRWRFKPGHFSHVRSPISFNNRPPPKT